MFKGVCIGILALKVLGKLFFDARMCWMIGVINGLFTVDSRVVAVIEFGDNLLVIFEVDKLGRLLFEEICEISYDELRGGIGFFYFG